MVGDPREIFSKRLKQGRLMRGLSLRALAESLDGDTVSYNALAKYEKAQMLPSSGVIVSLSNALNLQQDFFFRSFSLELGNVSFRKRSGLSKKVENIILESAKDFFERYLEVEEIVNDEVKYEPLEDLIKSKIKPDPEDLALELRKVWNLGLDPINNVHELLEEKGIKVYLSHDNDPKFDGLCADSIQDGNEKPYVVLSRTSNILRRRMTAVHELAHIVSEKFVADLPEREQERYVNKVGASILMPKDFFISVFGKSRNQMAFQELVDMKRLFGASISSIMYRARELELITESRYKGFIFKLGNKWRSAKKEPYDNIFNGREEHTRFKRLVVRAVSEQHISSVQGANYLEMSLNEMRDLVKPL